MDSEIREALRRDPIRGARLLVRTGCLDEALSVLEGLWLAGDLNARQPWLDLLLGQPVEQRLSFAARLDRLAGRGLPEADALWREWFPSAARIVGQTEPIRRLREFLYAQARSLDPVLILGESGVGGTLAATVLCELSGRPHAKVHDHESPLPDFLEQVRAVTSAGTTLFVAGDGRPGEWEARVLDIVRERGSRLVVRGYFDTARYSDPLKVATFEIPPLRARLDDLPFLVSHLLRRFNAPGTTVSPEALEAMRRHEWPPNQNVRQLYRLVDMALEHGTPPGGPAPEILTCDMFRFPRP